VPLNIFFQLWRYTSASNYLGLVQHFKTCSTRQLVFFHFWVKLTNLLRKAVVYILKAQFFVFISHLTGQSICLFGGETKEREKNSEKKVREKLYFWTHQYYTQLYYFSEVFPILAQRLIRGSLSRLFVHSFVNNSINKMKSQLWINSRLYVLQKRPHFEMSSLVIHKNDGLTDGRPTSPRNITSFWQFKKPGVFSSVWSIL